MNDARDVDAPDAPARAAAAPVSTAPPHGVDVVQAPPSGPHGGWLRRHRVKVIASLLVGAGFAWVLHAGALPLFPSSEALSRVRWWTVAGYVGLWCCVHLIRGARWTWLLTPIHRVPMRRILTVSWIGFAGIVLLPFRAGEMVRPVLIRKKGHLSGWAATGTIGAERVIDGLCLSVMLFVALMVSHPLDPLPTHIGRLPVPASIVPAAAYAALGVFVAAFSLMGLFYWRRGLARRVTERVVGVVSRPLGTWLADRVEEVADGLRFLPRLRFSVPFIAATAFYWLLNAAASWLLAWGCGFHDITFAEACVSIGVLALGILVPNAPGFFGAFQIALYAGFAMYFPPAEVVGAGAAFVFLIYLSQLGVTLVAGVGSMLIERTGLREALEPEAFRLEQALD
jgi:glycosyltransferase 2 family protein